jgi:hypothetical protein
MKAAGHKSVACVNAMWISSRETLQRYSVSAKIVFSQFHGVPARQSSSVIAEFIFGGVGERLKPPVLKTGVHFVDRGFESRPLRHSIDEWTPYFVACRKGECND